MTYLTAPKHKHLHTATSYLSKEEVIMTVRDLRAKLNNMDDSYMITMQGADGMQKDITDVSQQGNNLTFMTDSSS